MSIAEQTQLPTGIWMVDRVHSSVGFSVKHMVVNTFRGRFEEFDAHLAVEPDGSAYLVGTAKSDSIAVKDDDLAMHLRSEEFFDSERYPELRFESSEIDRSGEVVEVEGQLTVKGRTLPVTARGTFVDVHEDTYRQKRVGLELETYVDRRQFGLEWNMPLPKGGVALANEVKLEINLALVRA